LAEQFPDFHGERTSALRETHRMDVAELQKTNRRRDAAKNA
jgi:hypothetical protein